MKTSVNPQLPPALNGRAILAKYRRMILGHQSTLLVGVFLMAIPAAWIAKVHADFKSRPDAKKRMVIGQVVFWTSMLAGFKILHASLFTLPDRKVLMPAGFIGLLRQLGQAKTRGPAAATLAVIVTGFGSFIGGMIGGFEGGRKLARILVPKVPQVSSYRYSVPDVTGNFPFGELSAGQASTTNDSFRTQANQLIVKPARPAKQNMVAPYPSMQVSSLVGQLNASPLQFGLKSRTISLVWAK